MAAKKALHYMGINLPISFKSSCNPLERNYKIVPSCQNSKDDHVIEMTSEKKVVAQRKSSFEDVTGMHLVQPVRKLSQNSLINIEEKHHSIYALKVYNKAESPSSLSDLYTQVAIVRKLNYKNLLPLKSIYEDDKSFYFLYDVPSDIQPLPSYILEGQEFYDEGMVASWIKQALSGLEYLHSHGITHGDLTLNSLLIRKNKGTLFIAGYEGNKLRVRTDSEKESPNINELDTIAPEIHLKRGYGQAADIWSIGVLTFLLLTGEYPKLDEASEQLHSKEKKTLASKMDLPRTFTAENIPHLALNLISQILVDQPISRPTAYQALLHPWFSSTYVKDPLSEAKANLSFI